MKRNRANLHKVMIIRVCFAALLAMQVPAFSQVDFSGEWAPRFHEDQPERVPGPELGDYLGLPINAAARIHRAKNCDVPLAAVDILIVWTTIIWGVVAVWPHFKWIAVAQLPYFVWVSIATVLQLSITAMNWGKT